MDSFRGSLLLASPALLDPNFRRTVVLIAEHNDEGAMGIVLNRPSDMTVEDTLPELAQLAGEGARVYVGGPVQQSAVLVLAEFDDPSAAADIVVDDVGFVRGDGDLEALEAATRRRRVFAGYAGWGAGQLESEMEQDSWLVEPAAGVDLLPDAKADLWGSILRAKGGPYRILALMPEDPTVN